MRLPALKKILLEDIPGAPSWIRGVIFPINSFMEAVYQALNKNISDDQNIAVQIKEINYITTSAYPVMSDIEFVSGLKIKATGLVVLAAFDSDTYVPAAGAVYAPWQDVNGTITIGSITGLLASKSYTIRLRIS